MKTLYLAIILIFAVLITSNSVFAQNVTNSTNSMPSNAIRTPNGGWITPLQTTNNSGGKLNIHVEQGVDVSGKIMPSPVTENMESPQQFQTPLQQFKSGIDISNIICDNGFQLIVKVQNYSPACVSPVTATKLILRSWGESLKDATVPVKNIDIIGLQNYTVGQPINVTISYTGYMSGGVYPDVEILDMNNSQVWSNCVPPHTETTMQFHFTTNYNAKCVDAYPIINKTGTYTMIASLDNKSASTEFVIVKSLLLPGAKEIVTRNQTSSNQNSNSSLTLSNTMTGLRYDVGTINWNNQTYYFETPNYTETTSGQPAQILFHDVIFTLFPSSFGGIPLGGCEGMHYFTYARFSDGTSEELHVFVGSPSCGYDYTPIKLSTHTNPQAGLTVYDGKMKLLVSVENK